MGSSTTSRRAAVVLVVVMTMLVGLCHSSKCGFEAIFNFGDSNSDTGGFWAAFPAQGGPHGMTYFKRPAGRATDGRLTIDFIAEALGLPYLSPYLKSVGSDFRHGANFATLGSTVMTPNTSLFVSGISPFPLSVQLNQMKQFKAEVDAQNSQGPSNLPPSDIFGKSLYTFNIGQNDLTSNFASMGTNVVQQYGSSIAWQIASTIKEIYGLGGRTFLVQNTAPIGCQPGFLVKLAHKNSDIDQFGCMYSYNTAVIQYNEILKEVLRQTREQYKDANIIYADTYKVLLELFQHPTSHGLMYSTRACCGTGGGNYNFDPKNVCGSSSGATACGDPYNYVSWDGIHTTEAANKQVADAIIAGYYSDPSFKFQCN